MIKKIVKNNIIYLEEILNLCLKDIWANLREELFMRKQKKNKKRRKKLIILLVVLLLFFPIIGSSEEGVVLSYRAILYSYRRYRVLDRDGSYHTVPEFLVLPFNFLY